MAYINGKQILKVELTGIGSNEYWEEIEGLNVSQILKGENGTYTSILNYISGLDGELILVFGDEVVIGVSDSMEYLNSIGIEQGGNYQIKISNDTQVYIAKLTKGASVVVDQVYNPESKNAQSGTAVAEAVENTVQYIETKTLKVEENVITNDNIVTLSEGWSGNLASGFTHAKGNTAPLTFNVNANDGEKYLIQYDWDLDDNPRAITLKLGNADNIDNVYATDPYVYGNIKWGLVCEGNNGVLQIIPSATYEGTISNIKLQKISDSGTNEVEITLENIENIPLENHLSGFYNISLGKNALKNSVNTTRCLAIGGDALRELKTGGRNICLGTYALSQMVQGENNISIGADSSFEIEEAQDCIAIGKAAMSCGKKMTNNIAIGSNALYGYGQKDGVNSTGNVAIGHSAGYKNANKYNVFIGDKAGYNNAGYFGTYIGTDAGRNSTGNYNTCIGMESDVTGGYNKCTAIGYGAKATKNNQVVIGADDMLETLLKGDLVVRGTDGTKRKLVFNADNTISWVSVQ